MGKIVFKVDPKARHVDFLQGYIDRLSYLSSTNDFLTIPENGETVIYVTDNPKSFNAANQEVLRKGGVRVTADGFEGGNYSGFMQRNGERKVILIHPLGVMGKNPINTLIHEVGHFKWINFGKGEPHDIEFYKMLSDVLNAFGVKSDINLDFRGIDLSNTPNPLGDNIFGNIDKYKWQRQKGELPLRDSFGNLIQHASLQDDGPPEGLRHNAVPIVVSIGPNVVNTPMGSSEVPVAYNQIGFFDDSIKTTRSVYFTSNQSFTMASRVAITTGDEAGSSNGGIASGTRSGEAEPIEASTSVKAEGNYVIRDDDAFWLNNHNCTGRAIFQIIGTPKDKKIT